MRSAVGVSLPRIAVTGPWHHAATVGRAGNALRLPPRGSAGGSAYSPTRFNPGNLGGSGFDTLYLALDRNTALFEKRAQFGDPFGAPTGIVVGPRMSNVAVVVVDVILQSVVDLTDVGVHGLIQTTAQELTGDWVGYEQRSKSGPSVVLTAPTGIAPTQQLGRDLFLERDIEGMKVISAKVPTTCCLVVFIHNLVRPGSFSWDDPNTGQRETYP